VTEVLGTWGASRQQVRLVRRGNRLVCEWYESRLRREKSWPDKKGNVVIARSWAKDWADLRLNPDKPAPTRVTMRELWDLYQTECWATLSPNTQRLYADDWKKWELYAGRTAVAEEVAKATLHGFRRHLEQRGLGVNSVGQAIKTCKVVYNWGEREEVIERNRWRLYQYKIAKKDKPQSPEEYNPQETAAMMANVSPTGRGWRAWVALTILEQQGVRQVSGLQLKWSDLRLNERKVMWPSETDKNARGLLQPLRKQTVRALRVARDHAKRMGVKSPYVLYSARIPGKHYTAQSLWAALTLAEKKGGVTHKPMRAAHSLRRKLVGDLSDSTGDTLLALRLVGDRDPRRAEDYRKDRPEEAERAFKALDRRASLRDAAAPSHIAKTASDVDAAKGEE
jgi:site-specific recombinase XerD